MTFGHYLVYLDVFCEPNEGDNVELRVKSGNACYSQICFIVYARPTHATLAASQSKPLLSADVCTEVIFGVSRKGRVQTEGVCEEKIGM
jgi:hypothetical protein